jgi:type I restriction enzyme S subunit
MEFEFNSLPDWPLSTVDKVKAPGRSVVSGPFGSNIGSRFFVAKGVPVIRGNNLTTGFKKFVDSGFVYLTEKKAEEFPNCVAIRGDIVFTAAGTIGQVGIIPEDSKFQRYIISNKQLRIRFDESRILPMFAYYWFSSPAMIQLVQSCNTGSTIPLINLSVAKSLPVPVPEISHQTAVVETLSALDDRIDLLIAESQSLESLARAIFKSWFVDFDPVRAKAEGRDPEGMDAETAALFPSAFENSDLGSIPQGWKAVPFGALLESAIGGDWGKEEPDEVHTEQVAIIRGTDMPTIQAGFTSGIPVRFVSAKKLQSRRLRDSDIIIEVSGGSPKQPTGRSIFVSDALLEQLSIPAVPASFCRLFRATNPRVGLLLSQHLSHIYGEGKMWGYQNQSTGISNFQTKHFLESEYVCLPSDEVLDAFQQIVRPLIDKQQLKIASTLADLRDTLLPRLISGKLRVPEAEAMLMEVV